MQRTSDFLVALIDESTPKISVESLLIAFKTRAYGLFFLLFGLPNVLPLPGLPILCGVILLFVSVQLVIGNLTPWLPRWLLRVEIQRGKLALLVHKALPYIWKIERFSQMRFTLLLRPLSQRLIGLIVAFLAVSLIIIPIPWVGSMPQGLAIVILGLGILENDGVVLLIGCFFAGLASLVVFFIAYALYFGVGLLF